MGRNGGQALRVICHHCSKLALFELVAPRIMLQARQQEPEPQA
jgi:hypothetical protein